MNNSSNLYRFKNFYLISVLLLSSQCRKAVDLDRDAKRASDSETGSKARVKVESSELDNNKNPGNGTTAGGSSETNSSAKESSGEVPHGSGNGTNDSADSSVHLDAPVDTGVQNIQSEPNAGGYSSDADVAPTNVEITPTVRQAGP